MSYSDNSVIYSFLEKCEAIERVAEEKAQEALTHLLSSDNPANEPPKRREVLSYMIGNLSAQIVELQSKVALLEKQLEQ